MNNKAIECLGDNGVCIPMSSYSSKTVRKPTNADRIRAMSDEELAEFLPVVFDCMCNPTEKCMKNTFVRGECTKTTKCALRWLQSEAE